MQALGPSVQSLINFCGGKLSVRSTLLIARQMVARLSSIHAYHIIHNDIKPQNATIGVGDETDMIHLIDFGISYTTIDAQGQFKRMQ